MMEDDGFDSSWDKLCAKKLSYDHCDRILAFMLDNTIIEPSIRRRVYFEVADSPGITTRDVALRNDIEPDYALRVLLSLEKYGLIKSEEWAAQHGSKWERRPEHEMLDWIFA